jgi:type VI protein secretion system component VasF
MRGPKFEAIRGLGMAAFLGAAFLAAPSVGAAKAQQQGMGQSTPAKIPTIPPIDGERPDEGNDPMAAQQRASRSRAMADDRQKHIVDETTKLLQLATELKAAVDKSNKNELSLDVVKKADDIEKLAHDVKQRMRG